MADKLNQYLDCARVHVISLLDLDPCVSKFSKKAQETTSVPREYLALGLLAFNGLWLTYGYGAGLISSLIGVLYPAYMSVKAIDSPRHSDDTEWLMYWVVFGIITLFECFIDELLVIFPIYYLSKCIFLIWCFLPVNNNGSKLIYYHVVRHFVKKHEGKIDAAAKKLESHVKNAKNMLDTVKDLPQDLQTMSTQVMSSVEQQRTQTSVKSVEVRRMVQKVHSVESHVEGKFQIVDPTEIEGYEQVEHKH